MNKWHFTEQNLKDDAQGFVELVCPDGTLAGVQLRTLVNGWGQYQDSKRKHIEELLLQLLNAEHVDLT